MSRALHASLALALFTATSAHAAPPPKVEVCHRAGQGYAVLALPAPAAEAHVRHGDALAGAWWPDLDGDGFGDSESTPEPCPTPGLVDNAWDCDDGDPDVNPAASEVPYDGVDDDCDPDTPDDDLDGDGFGLDDDCDDLEAAVRPGAEEVCDNGVDDDCDGLVDEDCAPALTCRCFDEADLDAAYATFLSTTVFDYPQSAATCEEDDYSGHVRALSEVFVVLSGGPVGGHAEESWTFYATGVDDMPQLGDHCASFYRKRVRDPVTGRVVGEISEGSGRRTIPREEREHCEALLLDWADANALACPVFRP